MSLTRPETAIAVLYVSGVNINWEELNFGVAEHRLALPTYPFQRISCQLQENQKITNQSNIKLIPSKIAMNTEREVLQHKEIISGLRSILAKLLQLDISEVDVHSHLLEMGVDSLVLLEVVQEIEEIYKVKIVIHQLFEELATLNILATYIQEQLSSRAPTNSDIGESHNVHSSNSISSDRIVQTPLKNNESNKVDSVLEEVILKQLQIMSEQLQILQDKKKDIAVLTWIRDRSITQAY